MGNAFWGEEFIVRLSEIDPIDAIKIADRVRLDTEQAQVEINDTVIQYTVSIGLNITKQESSTRFARWIKAADDLVYRTKDEDRNRIVCEVSMPA